MWFGFETVAVDVIRPAYVNERGDEVADWAAATEHAEDGWIVQALDTAEQLGLRDAVTQRWRALAPVSADVTTKDRIRHAGRVYEVDGEIQPWPTPPGMLQHSELILKRVEG